MGTEEAETHTEVKREREPAGDVVAVKAGEIVAELDGENAAEPLMATENEAPPLLVEATVLDPPKDIEAMVVDEEDGDPLAVAERKLEMDDNKDRVIGTVIEAAIEAETAGEKVEALAVKARDCVASKESDGKTL